MLEKILDSKILDLTTNLPGPFATQMLGDLGAEILKIEAPTRTDLTRLIPPYIHNLGSLYLSLNRNKQSMKLNLKSEKGLYIFFQLLDEFDVIIEGFRPGVTKRLGIDYESVKTIKPNIIYCSLSGYGQNGPYSGKSGHDLNYFSEAGFFQDCLNMKLDPPFPLPYVPIGDIAGAKTAVIGILSAIIARHQTGQGQFVDVSIFDSLVSWLNGSVEGLGHLNSKLIQEFHQPEFSPLAGRVPYYSVFETKDNQFISIGAIEQHFWESICKTINREDFIPLQHKPEMYSKMIGELKEIFRQRKLDEWLSILPDACVSPVRSLDSLQDNKQLLSREMIIPIKSPNGKSFNGIAFPIKFSGAKTSVRYNPPSKGEHTKEILIDLGYSSMEIKKLTESNVI